MKTDAYLEFLRYCLNPDMMLPVSAKGIDWMDLMNWAEQQAIVGVIFGGINDARSQKGDGNGKLEIPFEDLMEWVGYAHDIEEQNKLVNQRCVEVAAAFQKDGFDTCILKGQGNAMMYPNPLLRMPGDIDLWAMPRLKNENEKLNIKEVIKYVRQRNPGAKACYHHVDYGEFKGIEVEVHYRPSFMNNLIANRRLQRWFNRHTEITDCEATLRSLVEEIAELPNNAGKITVPSWEFNVVFLLSHIYNHLIHEGVGLKQIIDYFYLLRNAEDQLKMENGKLIMTLRELGLMEIAGAVMWVLKEVLGLEERYLIAPVDERRGRFLFSEIMDGGNFGRYGTQMTEINIVPQKEQKGCHTDCDATLQSLVEENTGNTDAAIGRNILRLKRDVRLVSYFPSECLWEPIFRLWHFGWRVAYRM